jgi:predicted phage-related endonuclease
LLGENEVGLAGDRKVAWKTVISNRLDSKALKTDHPEIYEKYARESISRRFMIK